MSNLNYDSPQLIVEAIKFLKSVIVSMTDGVTHYDVAFCYVNKINADWKLYQSGIATQNRSILVAVNRRGSFVFNETKAADSDYVQEKLSFNSPGIATQICVILNSL